MINFNKAFMGSALLGLCILFTPQASFAKKNKKSPRKPATVFKYIGPSISFQELFQNPDDNDLKLKYARQQAAGGDFISAASMLEGMLYTSPNWDSARLFYAIVLAELDDRNAALYEFKLLDDRSLNARDQAISKAYLYNLTSEQGE